MNPKDAPRSGEKEPAKGEQARSSFEIEIERQVAPLVPGNAREQVVNRVIAVFREEVFKGPLPHPKHFEEYERICPGAADRIIALAENAQRNAKEINNTILDHASEDQKLGMWLGFSALVLLIGSAVICGLAGHDALAGAFLTAGALGLVGKFIAGRSKDDETVD